ncbi:hypothetical protein Tco_1093967 [Tanacetum coccineum]|uniref:Transposase-associated domain-containing protein n=1 Tax=Tanacetum coccineum TaxID=301880 RepID=A0ABQ5IFK4_9ASTR
MLPKFSQIVNRLYAFIYETNHSKSGLGLPSIVALVMVIDKSWTSLGKHEKAFYTGLKKFVDDCKPLVDSAGNIRCPCKSCRLVLWVSIKHLSDHISKYGFDPSYKTWIHHGEPDLPPPPPVIDNTRQPQMSDMTACLNDLSYIPLNNEQNEPTQGDIGETSNDPTQAKRNEFEELYASANEELYPGCDHVTRLDFMAKFTYFKVKDQECSIRVGADGFKSVRILSQSYSIWPVILDNIQSASWTLMVYLRPLIDDLKVLWAKPGVETIDVATGLKFNMRAMVLWTINDFPARSSLSGWSGQGYRHALHNASQWMDGHLEFNGETKTETPPREFLPGCNHGTQLASIAQRVNGKHPRTPPKARQDLKAWPSRSALVASANNKTEVLEASVRILSLRGQKKVLSVHQRVKPTRWVRIQLQAQNSDDEDLVNLDIDDGVNVVYSSEEED